jgi:sulfotransferase family protein
MTMNSAIELSPDTVYYHVTHWKAGSQWFLALLKDAFPDAVAEPQDLVKHVYINPPQNGRIYPCCYLTQPEFAAVPAAAKAKRFVLIRDLRDTLVSGYFSMRYTHSLMGQIEKYRWFLNRWSMEEGLIYLMDVWLLQSALIQRSWLASGERVFKLEDCMERPDESLRLVFSEGWGLEVPPGATEKLAGRHAFTNYSGGRKPGQEDTKSHYRKGVRGDWRQYFTPRVTERFKALYNDLLLAGGYEATPDW